MRYLTIVFFLTLLGFFSYSQIQYNPPAIMEGSDPCYSPDGRYLAYSYKNNICTYNFATNEKKQVTMLQNCNNPRWNPKGDKIIFQSYGNSKDLKNRHFSIWIVNIDGTNPHKFVDEVGQSDQYPFWSPDGNKIAWTHGKQIWIANSNGKNCKQLSKNPAKEFEMVVDWSKDSKTILTIKTDDSQSKSFERSYICLIDTAENYINRITNLNEFIFYAKFSNDNNQIYYLTYKNKPIDEIKAKRAQYNSHITGVDNLIKIYSIQDSTNYDISHTITLDKFQYMNYFDFSPNYKYITISDVGDHITPKIYIVKLK